MTGPMPGAPRRWWQPAPDSVVGVAWRQGRSGWGEAVHLLWSVWLFVLPAFTPRGYDVDWLVLTAASYPVFLALFAGALILPSRHTAACALGMVALGMGLLPWYVGGLSYFVFGCVFLGALSRGGVWRYMGGLLILNALLLLWGRNLGYPWVALGPMPVTTLVIGLLVYAERRRQAQDAALRLSHEEVRRLAAVAERERIGRDLHDVLGHTLSMVALKSDLAARLAGRDPARAAAESSAVADIARQALGQMRSAVSGIRAAGLAAELAAARVLLETDGIAFAYHIAPDLAAAALPAAAESALALTLREAVTNIQRHARAHHVRVHVAVRDAEVVLQVHDDGAATGAIVPGNGLSGMRERIEALGGRLQVSAADGRGLRLEAAVPLAAAPTRQAHPA